VLVALEFNRNGLQKKVSMAMFSPQLSQAMSSITVGTETKVEIKIACALVPGSRPYILASMKGPEPMGKALISMATIAQSLGTSKTHKHSTAVTMG
jgi:hypothetical protein